jgi:histone arginine demethylase JMJD6
MASTKELYLTPDERYDVWEVKKEERPHLLLISEEDSSSGSSDDDSEVPLPLIDGCDVSGWRRSQLVPISRDLASVLNVGSGCSLLRRETQLPVVSSSALSKWRQLQERFMQEPLQGKNSAARIDKEEAIKLSYYPWFERDNVPVVLEGLTDDWRAMKSCRWNDLVANFGDFYWRFSDTHGAGMTLETYQKYISTPEGVVDDAPLAVYDSQLLGDERACLLEDYDVPTCFAAPDLFQELGEEERPPYRWILMGPARSGTGLHVDPMGTHAWVTVVEGLKRWVLFPYKTDQELIGMQNPQIPSALWFAEWYDRAIEAVPGVIEVLQRPGETVYVPAGWSHLVLNLEPTVAITHNYATEYPTMERISESVQKEEPELYPKWMQVLQITRPDLVRCATNSDPMLQSSEPSSSSQDNRTR